ncbi:histidine phosphatase family protein [Metabacillus sp. HB246100]
MGANSLIHVYLIRHGITKYNLDTRYLGHTDEPLLYNNQHQFSDISQQLADTTFDYCFTSDLKRCTQTSRLLLNDHMFCEDKRLRELHFGDWEGATYQMLKHLPAYQAWLHDMVNIAPPNGESFVRLKARVNEFFQEFFSVENKKEKNVLLVTHGGVIRACLIMFKIAKNLWDYPIEHGKGFKLSFQFDQHKEEWICNSWSEVPTLEKGL